MFVSANWLSIKYGVHDEISQFFVDREPPAGNLYWHGKLMYLRPTPGYLFIPVMADLFHRIGIPKEEVMGDTYVQLMEAIGHIAAKEEARQLSHAEAVEACIALVKDVHVNRNYYEAVVDYLRGGSNNFITPLTTPYKALHRGDVFLLSACVLHFDDDQARKIVEYWFAAISLFLLLDDAEDLEMDRKTGEENAFLESGLGQEGVAGIKHLLGTSVAKLKTMNVSLARTLDASFVKMAEQPHIKQYL